MLLKKDQKETPQVKDQPSHKYYTLDIVEDNNGDQWRILSPYGHFIHRDGTMDPMYRASGPLNKPRPQPSTIHQSHITKIIQPWQKTKPSN